MYRDKHCQRRDRQSWTKDCLNYVPTGDAVSLSLQAGKDNTDHIAKDKAHDTEVTSALLSELD